MKHNDSFVTHSCDSYLEEFLKLATDYQLKYGSWSYKAFAYKYSHGYFKNIVSRLQKSHKIARIEPRSKPAFYRVIGVDLHSNHSCVTLDRTGAKSEFVNQLFNIVGSKQPAIHDIRLVSYATGLHNACVAKGYPLKHISKDIILLDWKLDAWRSVKVTVHNNDKFSVMFACSNKPIMANVLDVIDWFVTLGRLQEKISSITCIEIPHPSLWQVRGLHFNQDMYSGVDLPEGLVITTRDISGSLVRIYTKQLPNESKPIVRMEIVEDSTESKPLYQKASALLSGD